MAGLGETVAKLSRLRRGAGETSGVKAQVPFKEARGFGFNPGALRMLAYVPAALEPNAPLVVTLHGCSQRAAAYARTAGWLTLSDRLGFALVAPEQDNQNNANRCFNWFDPADARRGAGEAASIIAMVEHMCVQHGLDRSRVFVTGLSAGGAMTAALLASYPERFAGGAVVAGLPFGIASNVQEAFAAMRSGTALSADALGRLAIDAAPRPEHRPRLSIWHGQADATVVSSNARALAVQWAAVHGLAAEPEEVRLRQGRTRSVWRSEGEALVELNLIAGLGHGTPLAAAGEDPIGEVAPFMLEAGVSSSLEIARFWGLAPELSPAQRTGWSDLTPDEPQPSGRLGEDVLAAVSAHVSDDVRNVIAKALASAGLMR